MEKYFMVSLGLYSLPIPLHYPTKSFSSFPQSQFHSFNPAQKVKYACKDIK